MSFVTVYAAFQETYRAVQRKLLFCGSTQSQLYLNMYYVHHAEMNHQTKRNELIQQYKCVFVRAEILSPKIRI